MRKLLDLKKADSDTVMGFSASRHGSCQRAKVRKDAVVVAELVPLLLSWLSYGCGSVLDRCVGESRTPTYH